MAKKKRRKKKTTGKGRVGASLLGSLDRAIEDASRRAFKEALAVIPGTTRVGRFLDQLANSPYMEHLRALSLDELAEAVRAAAGGARRAAPAAKPGRAAAPSKRRRGKSYNTRTAKGRAQIDRAVAAFLEKAERASAEEVRAAVGGTAAQVRESLTRLIKEKKVTKSGQRRGTRYHWAG